ncbi:hypothetical protein QBC47DRAFT_418170 [Echria macrotheca]|uniref:Uncharacterized protein n=1 Tax=Echria macrotheca TaxID=438768 RepID=A0AAJ0B6U0_9PEZI|nr:hypothetical protein QBC47DRAFT_418170 [Echria macrotheca]
MADEAETRDILHRRQELPSPSGVSSQGVPPALSPPFSTESELDQTKTILLPSTRHDQQDPKYPALLVPKGGALTGAASVSAQSIVKEGPDPSNNNGDKSANINRPYAYGRIESNQAIEMLGTSESSDSDCSDAEYRKFLAKQRELKRRKRMISNAISIRSINDSIGSDSDAHGEEFKPLQLGSTARHLRRRAANHRQSQALLLNITDRSESASDESDSGDEVRGALARELPFYNRTVIDYDSDDLGSALRPRQQTRHQDPTTQHKVNDLASKNDDDEESKTDEKIDPWVNIPQGRVISIQHINPKLPLSNWRGSPRWFSLITQATPRHIWNRMSWMWQPMVPLGEVRISWTCRCGDVLRIQVPESFQQAAEAFAKRAAGQNLATVVSQTGYHPSSVAPSSNTPTMTATHGSYPINLTPSSSDVSTEADTTTSASTSSTTSSSRPDSPNTIPSDSETHQPEPFIPAGTKKFMLLCVNTTSARGTPQKRLANVDVTDINCGEQMFQRLQSAYHDLRKTSGIKNPFLVPKNMQYIKFQLLFLQKSGECIANYEPDSIPSLKEVLRQEYAFSPCPPQIGSLPLPPDLFMHGFLDPGDHFGPGAVDILPKKLWSPLRWEPGAHGRYNVPDGWGFYIIEGINWSLISLCMAVASAAITIVTVAWSVRVGDVQGGTGLGQYCLAVLTLSVSVWLLKYSIRDQQ